MSTMAPVMSPVACYRTTGGTARRMRRTPSYSLRAHNVGCSQGSRLQRTIPQDFPLPRARRHRWGSSPVVLVLPLLTCVTAACATNDAAASHFLVVKLPASIVLLLLAGVGCGLAGFGLGLIIALQFLRAADRAANQYHRAEIARVLSASSTVHASVQEVLSIVHRRTQELQRLVAMLQRGGAK